MSSRKFVPKKIDIEELKEQFDESSDNESFKSSVSWKSIKK